MILPAFALLALSSVVAAHSGHNQAPVAGPYKDIWYNTLPGDGGIQVRMPLLLPFKPLVFVQDLSVVGRLCVQRYFDLWQNPISSMSSQR